MNRLLFCLLISTLMPYYLGAQDAIAIIADQEKISIRKLDNHHITMQKTEQGIVIWQQEQIEYRKFLPGGSSWSLAQDSKAQAGVIAKSKTAGNMDLANVISSTTQLAKLPVTLSYKGFGGILLPPRGAVLLFAKITLRRKPGLPGAKFVLQGKNIHLPVIFADGQTKKEWQEIAGNDKNLARGLPSGNYVLSLSGKRSEIVSRFSVAEPRYSRQVLQLSQNILELGYNKQNSLYLLVLAESLLVKYDDNGEMMHMVDVYNTLADAPSASLTPYLFKLRKQLLDRIAPPVRSTGKQNPIDKEATGIEVIDRARALIEESHWREALDLLDRNTQAKKTGRITALADLYRGVIYAEAGMGNEHTAEKMFQKAIRTLDTDLFRAHNNYANFLTRQGQDYLNNHAFRMATGEHKVLLKTVDACRKALQHYHKALAAATESHEQCTVRLNIARLYLLLADIVETVANKNTGTLSGDIQSQARNLADKIANNSQLSLFERSAANDIVSMIYFRRGNMAQAIEISQKTSTMYEKLGAIGGMESNYRLTGLCFLNNDSEKVLKNFLVSHILTQILRNKVPADQVGLTLAGFFARRAYVNAKIIEILIAQGKNRKALEFVERTKAEALLDMLDVQSDRLAYNNAEEEDEWEDEEEVDEEEPEQQTDNMVPTISQILSQWPEQTAALEYFIGDRQSWVFIITKDQVKVYPIANGQKPIASRQVVTDVWQVLQDMDHYAYTLLKQLEQNKKVDNSWQDDLFRLRQQLLPDLVLQELRKYKLVLIVPHHVLHYLPFAALVVKKDLDTNHKKMARPQFVLDEPFDICPVPSLKIWKLLEQGNNHLFEQVGALAISDFNHTPLPGAEQDLENLQSAFGKQFKSVFFNAHAQENNARTLLKEKGLTLFATHGFNYPEQPLNSCLLLRKSNEDDGQLTAKEIFRQSIKAQLIILSACYSGLAEHSPMPGDNLFGLNRAFLQSGAQGVVSSVWDVYDGTGPIILKDFFDYLAMGIPAYRALAESKRTFLHKRRLSMSFSPWLHPYFWAVYRFSGNPKIAFRQTDWPIGQLSSSIRQKLDMPTRGSKRVELIQGEDHKEWRICWRHDDGDTRRYRRKIWAVIRYSGRKNKDVEHAEIAAQNAGHEEKVSGYLKGTGAAKTEAKFKKRFYHVLGKLLGKFRAKKFRASLLNTKHADKWSNH